MNLKPNLWTLLFAITLGLFLWQLFSNPKRNNEKDFHQHHSQGIGLSDTIPSDTALSRWIKYFSHVMDSNIVDSINREWGVVNSNVTMFKMQKNELLEMVSYFNGEDVVAYLTIKAGNYDGTNNPVDTIDLIFSDGDLLSGGSFQYDGKFQKDPALLEGERTLYFDFTRPCPPLCND